MSDHAAYIGLDVHKDTIATAVAEPVREHPAYEVEIANTANRIECKARQQLNAFVLCHGHHWSKGRSRSTQSHYNWLESPRGRPSGAEGAGLAPVVEVPIDLRGIDKVAVMVLLAELGDISRFDSPRLTG